VKLTTHFDLAEFTHSQAAGRLGIDNTAPQHVLANLARLAQGMELVRMLLGDKPLSISSGYRCGALNKAVGGSAGSQHLTGQACDFICPAYGTPAQIVAAIVASDVPFDQVIQEFDSWVHISFSDRNRRQALIIDKKGARAWSAS